MFNLIERRFKRLPIPPEHVVLTFDDGPVPGQTDRLLDLLGAAGVPAGFCLVGQRIEGQEALVRRMTANGHTIINHSFTHRTPQKLPDAEILSELDRFDAQVQGALGDAAWRSRFYRPPSGLWEQRLAELVHGSGRSLMPMTYFAWDPFWMPQRIPLLLFGLKWTLKENRGGLLMLHEALVPLKGESDPAPARNQREWLLELVDKLMLTVQDLGMRFVSPEVMDGWDRDNG
ncbi:MAG: polysaccharide deacetylase family protein [Opitutales bacterium]